MTSLRRNCEPFPAEDEVAQERTNEYTDDDVPIVIHGEQHNEVSDGKLQHVK